MCSPTTDGCSKNIIIRTTVVPENRDQKQWGEKKGNGAAATGNDGGWAGLRAYIIT